MVDRARSLIASGFALFGAVIADKVWMADLADLLQATAALILVIAGIIAPQRRKQRDRELTNEVMARVEEKVTERRAAKRERKKPEVSATASRGEILSVPGPTTNQPKTEK